MVLYRGLTVLLFTKLMLRVGLQEILKKKESYKFRK
jgi:hypothetical protein